MNVSKKPQDCKGKKYYCIIRPEYLGLDDSGVKAKIINKFFHGSSWSYEVDIGQKYPLLSIANLKDELEKNQVIKINTNKKNILIFQE